jgi:hypothetical protein
MRKFFGFLAGMFLAGTALGHGRFGSRHQFPLPTPYRVPASAWLVIFPRFVGSVGAAARSETGS